MTLITRVGFVLTVIAVTASTAAAGTVKVGSTYGPYQSGIGGEFTVIGVSGVSNDSYDAKAKGFTDPASFQTFCVENSFPPEYIELNTTYNTTLNTIAMNGGVLPAGTGDPLSQGTGWLYSQFAQGTLTGYNYAGTTAAEIAARKTSASLLQQTFWWLEGEGGIVYNASNIFMAAVVAQFGSEANAILNGTGDNYGVRVLNMVKLNGTLGQDQLYYTVPDAGSTALLLGCALTGLGILRRKGRA